MKITTLAHAQAAAKRELPVVLIDKIHGDKHVYRRIAKVTAVYAPQKGMEIMLEDMTSPLWNVWTNNMNYIEVLEDCRRCPDLEERSDKKCKKCVLYKSRTDLFDCVESELCPVFNEDCTIDDKECATYGICKCCRNQISPDICASCIRKEVQE